MSPDIAVKSHNPIIYQFVAIMLRIHTDLLT